MDGANLHGKHVTVMGLGRFGGGVGVARWLAAQGARVRLTDLDSAEALRDSLAKLDDLIREGVVQLRLGEHITEDFTRTDLVVANPAVPKPWENRFLRAAMEAGVPVTTEIRLLVERLPNPQRVIAVTGSVGKSTTSAMIHHALRGAGRTVYFGGNIGGSLLGDVSGMSAEADVVLEVSSAMLYWLSAGVGYASARGWSPRIAVVTNLVPNHLDWHGELEHYRRSKQQILRDQNAESGDRVVIHESLAEWLGDRREGVKIVRDADADGIGALAIPGRHNRLNAAVALAAVMMAGVEESRVRAALATFPGLPHRLEFVGEFGRAGGEGTIRAYNDSKSTTPESCALAIEAMRDDASIGVGRVRLICGGYDKKVELGAMCRSAVGCAGVYTIGATGKTIAEQVNAAGGRAAACETLERAVAMAMSEAAAGDVLLLSPGCASWDQFTNYEQRGGDFARFVRDSSGVRS